MEREAVTSSNLVSVGYDESSMTLEVEFGSGSIYQYFDVPASVRSDLISAESVGSFFAAHVKGVYRYAQL